MVKTGNPDTTENEPRRLLVNAGVLPTPEPPVVASELLLMNRYVIFQRPGNLRSAGGASRGGDRLSIAPDPITRWMCLSTDS